MRIRPIGTSLLIELVERAKRESGLVVRKQDQTVFTGEVVRLSSHLETNSSIREGDTVIFVGRFVDTPVADRFIIDAEQIIGVLEIDEDSE